jgi:Ran GTPase-activating protein (RanGAP) involved in mRNA processing and transport
LKNLELAWNAIDDKGMKGLAEALKVNSSLHSLDLKTNQIGADGAEAMAKTLKKKHHFEDIGVGLEYH